MTSRRDFVRTAAGAGIGAALGNVAFAPTVAAAPAVRRRAVRPVAIASSNGLAAVNRAVELILAGQDTLQAVVEGVNINELDPEDMSVGYGGLPNEDGVVQLDSSVMHGPTRGAGAVAALEGVKTPSRVAVAVMRYTDHILLVGEGARDFARKMGFDVDQNLLTDEARQRWLAWRAGLSPNDNWLTPRQSGENVSDFTTSVRPGPDTGHGLLDSFDGVRPWGTINCNAVNAAGDISGCTTTSGLAWKMKGRVGDSPIIGAGLYVDNDVGACGSTGRGEAAIKIVGSHTVVENMRRGMSPTDACLDAIRRAIAWTVESRLRDSEGRPRFNLNLYAVNKNGDFGAAAIWSGSRFAVNLNGNGDIRDSAFVFQRPA